MLLDDPVFTAGSVLRVAVSFDDAVAVRLEVELKVDRLIPPNPVRDDDDEDKDDEVVVAVCCWRRSSAESTRFLAGGVGEDAVVRFIFEEEDDNDDVEMEVDADGVGMDLLLVDEMEVVVVF